MTYAYDLHRGIWIVLLGDVEVEHCTSEAEAQAYIHKKESPARER